MAIEYFNGSQPWEILSYVDKITGFLFGDVMILIIWLTAFLAFGTNYPKNKAFAGATYLLSPIVLIFWYIGIVELNMVMLVMIMVFASIVLMGGTDKS